MSYNIDWTCNILYIDIFQMYLKLLFAPLLMSTTMKAGLLRLVCLTVSLFAAVPEGMGDTYDAVVVAHRLSLERPDPHKPFTVVTGSNGEEASDANLYLSDPENQINGNQTLFVSLVVKFRSRQTGEFVAVKRPNITNASFTFMGRKHRDGYAPETIGGAFNVILNDCSFTDVDDINPNPGTGGAWIYGVHEGSVVTTKGAKIKLTEGDGAIRMNPGAGDFLIHPDADHMWSELWIVGAEQRFSSGFLGAYNSILNLARLFGIPAEVTVEVTNAVGVDSALNSVNGCRTYPSYGAFRFPTIYCGTADRKSVKPVWELSADTSRLILRRGKLGAWQVQASSDMMTWQTLPGYVYAADPLEDRRGMVIKLPDWSQITHPPPQAMFYRLWSPAPPLPPTPYAR